MFMQRTGSDMAERKAPNQTIASNVARLSILLRKQTEGDGILPFGNIDDVGISHTYGRKDVRIGCTYFSGQHPTQATGVSQFPHSQPKPEKMGTD